MSKMVLFPHLNTGLHSTPARAAWSCRRSFLLVPVLVIVGFVGFVYLRGTDVVPADYRHAFDFASFIGGAPPFSSSSSSSSSSTSTAPPAVPTFSDPLAPVDTSPEEDHTSPFSFDIDGDHPKGGGAAGRYADWMAAAPDALSLAHLSIPGTHDTMTHNVDLLGYRCQNADLRKQLHGGVRYLDIRARVQVDPDHDDPVSDAPRPLGIYHGHVYTGYGFASVLQTVTDFLTEFPSETIVMRLKEEGRPIYGSARDPVGPGPDNGGGDGGGDDAAPRVPSKSGAPFLDAFQHYLLDDDTTASQFAAHLYGYGEAKTGAFGMQSIPTLGALRGKVLLLQEFPYFPQQHNYMTRGAPRYGIPWQLESDLLAVEDKWQMRNLDDLDMKWDVVQKNLQAAAFQAVHPPPGDDHEGAGAATPKLYLSHLSASVGVTPIDAAAGPTNRSTVGINDRAGEFVERGEGLYGDDSANKYTPIGIVMADFPGMRLMKAIVERNKHMH